MLLKFLLLICIDVCHPGEAYNFLTMEQQSVSYPITCSLADSEGWEESCKGSFASGEGTSSSANSSNCFTILIFLGLMIIAVCV